jgi:hypothetical protein
LARGDTPDAFVWSMNVERRHLTATQKSDAALSLEELTGSLKALAKERQRASGGPTPKKAVPPTLEEPVETTAPRKHRSEALEGVADIVGVSASTVYDVQRLRKRAADGDAGEACLAH